MADVFISYSRKDDREQVERLVRLLQNLGITVWLDSDISPGNSFQSEILRELESAKVVLALWSPASVQSKFVEAEASLAVRRGVLVPAILSPVQLPDGFSQYQAADLSGWTGELDHPGFQRILQALAVHGVHVEPQNDASALSKGPSQLACTVFAPPSARPREVILVQTCLHLASEFDDALREAHGVDASTAPRGSSIELLAQIGSPIRIAVEAPNLLVSESDSVVTWHGQRTWVFTRIEMPDHASDRRFLITVRVFIDDIPAGNRPFIIDCRESMKATPPTAHPWAKYGSAFISYCRADVEQALNGAQLLSAIGVSVFQDVLRLDPGQRWKREIYRRIDEADLFLLYWSKAAKRSKWVVREARYAADLAASKTRPDVIPYILEGPPPVRPPRELADYNFFDPIRCVNTAHRRRRGWLWG